MIHVETLPGMGGRGKIKENDRRGEFIWYVWYIVRTFVNATCSPTQQRNKKERKNKSGESEKKSLKPHFFTFYFWV
jgi:hypothetical protein